MRLSSILQSLIVTVATIASLSSASAYEINNHADMSQRSAEMSFNGAFGLAKLARLGLKPAPIASDNQRFPLDTNLGPIPYCFGSDRPTDWQVTIPFNSLNYPTTQQVGNGVAQPDWVAAGGPKLTIAEFIRYGACYEDEEEPNPRSLSHFYNPQNDGVGAPNTSPTELALREPSSLDWMLKRGVGTTKTGTNHYTWMDARNNFYYALTGRNLDPQWPITGDVRREAAWGRTFQALGHIVHHLQDMGSPQHVRSDYHCNSTKECRDAWYNPLNTLGLYRPCGYETYFERQFNVVRGLAASATAPIVFGLPREFWNTNTDNALSTTNATRYMSAQEGLAAYTSTNFPSVGTDFLKRQSDQLYAVIPIEYGLSA